MSENCILKNLVDFTARDARFFSKICAHLNKLLYVEHEYDRID